MFLFYSRFLRFLRTFAELTVEEQLNQSGQVVLEEEAPTPEEEAERQARLQQVCNSIPPLAFLFTYPLGGGNRNCRSGKCAKRNRR